MFQTIEQTSRMGLGRRLLMMMISIVAHAVTIFVFVILPLLFFNVLPESKLLAFLTEPPAPPAPPPPASPPAQMKAVAAQKILIDPGEFRSPTEIPDTLPLPGDEPHIPAFIGAGVPGGIPGGVPGGVPGGTPGSILGLATPPPPPAPALKPVRHPPLRIGGDVQASKLIKRVEPVYPVLAIRARVSGTVILEVTVDEEGNVADIKVLRGNPLLNDEAVRAVRQWKYSPTLLNGEPVPVTAAVTVIFTLR